MPKGDIKTQAIVLRRTKYGEADRILNLLTPEGHIAVIAKGVRKAKSRLAGGIEMFCVSNVGIHQGKSEFGILTSAKMVEFYQNIISDLSRFELGSSIIKQAAKFAEALNTPELFDIVKQCFAGLNDGYDLQLVESWFLLNLMRISGEDINLIRDTSGNKLNQNETYVWDSVEQAFSLQPQGKVGVNEIKILRLILSVPLATVSKVNGIRDSLPEILHIAKSVAKQ